MKAVILAAGEGSRLRPFTHSEPKVMIPVANIPILQYVVEALVESGVKDIIMVVGYKSTAIMSHFEDGGEFGANIEYVHQNKQLGTAHALNLVSDHVSNDFLVIAGDNIISKETLSQFVGSATSPSMLVTHSDVPSKYGVVTMDGDKILTIQEKPETHIGNLISTGIYLLDMEFLAGLPAALEDGAVGITKALEVCASKGRLKGVLCKGIWLDAVYPWDLLDLNSAALSELTGKLGGTVEEGAYIKGHVEIGEGTVVRSGSYVQGPVKIGAGCDIGPGSVLFPSTSIGDNTAIGAHATVRNSVIMEDVVIGDGGIIEDSVIACGVRISAGCTLPSESSTILLERECHDISHIGAMLGEDTHVGPLASFSPGVVVGWGCRIGPHSKVTKNLEDRTVMM